MKSKLTLKCTCHRIHTNRFLMDPCKIHKHYYVKTSKKVKPNNKNKTLKRYKTLKHSLLKKKTPLRKITQSQKQTRKVSNTIPNKKSKKKTKKVRFSIDLKKGTTDKKEVKEVKMNNTVELDNSVEVNNTVKEKKKPKKHNVARGIEPEYDLKKVNIAKLKNKITIIKSCNEDDCQEIKNFINVNICDINTPINELMQFFTSLSKTDQQFIYNKIIRTHN